MRGNFKKINPLSLIYPLIHVVPPCKTSSIVLLGYLAADLNILHTIISVILLPNSQIFAHYLASDLTFASRNQVEKASFRTSNLISLKQISIAGSCFQMYQMKTQEKSQIYISQTLPLHPTNLTTLRLQTEEIISYLQFECYLPSIRNRPAP